MLCYVEKRARWRRMMQSKIGCYECDTNIPKCQAWISEHKMRKDGRLKRGSVQEWSLLINIETTVMVTYLIEFQWIGKGDLDSSLIYTIEQRPIYPVVGEVWEDRWDVLEVDVVGDVRAAFPRTANFRNWLPLRAPHLWPGFWCWIDKPNSHILSFSYVYSLTYWWGTWFNPQWTIVLMMI